jgi:sulfane dehydrogenase subunit SoxC
MSLLSEADIRSAPLGSSDDAGLAPLWRPTPLSALELPDLPTHLHFVRNHFAMPAPEADSWSLELVGSRGSLVVGLAGLRRFSRHTLRVMLECAGHRRVEFGPLASGIPWRAGAVGEARWTGTSLARLLEWVGIPAGAHEVVLDGADSGPVPGFHGTHRYARSLPLLKALRPDVLLAYEMNGQPIPREHGGPVRAIVPGWYATDSVKWLDRIWFTDQEFTGVFQAHDYRLARPGEPGPGRRLTELPVHALLTTPGEAQAMPGQEMAIRGVAWGGTGGVARVLVQVDGGPSLPAQLGMARGTHACVSWVLPCRLAAGEHEAACWAIEGSGAAQPERPIPNVGGYANNAVHRVRFRSQ